MIRSIINLVNRINTKYAFAICVLLLVFIYFRQEYQINSETAYTVGRIYEINYRRYDYSVNYFYYFNNELHLASTTTPKAFRNGENVIVKFSRKYPATSKIEQNYVLPDTTILRGQVWEAIPSKGLKKRKFPL